MSIPSTADYSYVYTQNHNDHYDHNELDTDFESTERKLQGTENSVFSFCLNSEFKVRF